MTLEELRALPVWTLVRMDVATNGPPVGETDASKYGIVTRQWSGGTEISWEDHSTGSLAFSWQAIILHIVQLPRGAGGLDCA
jgi:hypothetical protein